VIRLSAAEVAALAGGTLAAGNGTGGTGRTGAAPVTGPVVIDSRQAAPGALFAALPGERVDGHDYAAAAVAAGASVVLAARPLPGLAAAVVVVPDVTRALGLLARGVLARLPDATVVGITGSSGKTSTKDLTAQVVERLGPTVAPEGSLNNEIGLPLTVLRADEQTRYLVLEMSARGIGHIAYLTGIAPPRIGAVLNVGRAHAGEFGSLDAVAKAKGELVEALPAGVAAGGGVAVLNADDPNVIAMAARTRARVVTTSVQPNSVADVRATGITLDDLGRASFTLHLGGARYPDGAAPVALTLHGAHHVANALATTAIAAELGLDLPTIAQALSAATARSKKRMELHQRADGVLVVNDAYNANPESVRAALEALAGMGRSRGARTWAVLGEMAELGEGSTEAHASTGRLASELGISRIVAVGEGARAISAEWVPDADAAITLLRKEIEPGDIVLVKASHAIALERVALELVQ
jgi:UDP-N-acetylmuramoyl-tripeptide--D-alanyl-D-alanine ligase